MLSRRFIRIKVMQALYAFFHSEDKLVAKHEKEMFADVDRTFDLFLYLLLLLIEIRECGRNLISIRKTKHLPSKEDINPNTKFVDNKLFSILSINKQLASESFSRKIVWDKDDDLPQKLFNLILQSEEYKSYLSHPEKSFKEDKKFICDIYIKYVAENEYLQFILEEKNIHWADDIDFVNSMIMKSLDAFSEYAKDTMQVASLYKDEDEDKKFARELFRLVIEHSEEEAKMIQLKTENWELERIAFMDVLLMKMAITEFLYMPTVPVKVSLNEYIEIAKQYSTPKSSVFVNGVLDKLLLEFKKEGKLVKQGRGLIEN